MDDCPQGNNCLAGACKPALASCAEQKSVHGSPDGEYWINPGSPVRVYCDMQLGAVLCSETPTARTGKTREGSALTAQFMSVLKHAEGTCELWALRASNEYPLDFYNDHFSTGWNVCSALGFKAVAKTTGCFFGSAYGNCGYSIGSSYYRYGTSCSGCTQNNGQYATYVLQGYMNTATVATDYAGNARLTCKMK
jgi:hypothetical protein